MRTRPTRPSPEVGPRGARGKRLAITQTKSAIGQKAGARRTLLALGLRRLHQRVVRADDPSIRGMIARVAHLVRVEETDAAA